MEDQQSNTHHQQAPGVNAIFLSKGCEAEALEKLSQHHGMILKLFCSDSGNCATQLMSFSSIVVSLLLTSHATILSLVMRWKDRQQAGLS